MSNQIINGAPMTVLQGTKDNSTRPQVVEPEVLPAHLPKFYIFAEKGPLTPELVVGASLTNLYGDNTFDERKEYANHATVFLNGANAKGNSCMVQRLKPADAAGPAAFRIVADVLPIMVEDFERMPDGSIKLDSDNNPIPLPTKIAGHKVKYLQLPIEPGQDGEDMYGQGTQTPGDQVDDDSNTQSVRYPLFDSRVPSFGKHGNDKGLRIWAPTQRSNIPVDDRLITDQKVYPIRVGCVSRASSLTTPKIVDTLSAEQFINACFKPGTVNLNTDSEFYIEDVFAKAYNRLGQPGLPDHYGPFEGVHVYQDNIDALVEMFYATEVPHIDEFSDFDGSEDEAHRFNFLGGVSSQGVPYHSFQIITGQNDTVRFTENTTLWAMGGTDGTMNEEVFNALVTAEITEYGNPNSPLQNTAKYPESIFYDSGFALDTKRALANFIALRKDTFLVLSTHVHGAPPATASEESSLAVMLRSRVSAFPESDLFGTPAMRAMIIGRSGKLLDSRYKHRLPLSYEVLVKSADYMGAGDGNWKKGYTFDMAPLNQVTMFSDINVTFTPATVRNKDWAAGLNWVESFDRRSNYFPALKTVYDNDSSILTSYFTAMIIVECEKVGERVRRLYSGSSSLTRDQLIERVNQAVVDRTKPERFDRRVVVVPAAYYTEADIARGFSWTLPINVYGPNMMTVQTLNIQAYRMEDLPG